MPNSHTVYPHMCDMAVCLLNGDLCSFSTLLCISVAMHVTAYDVCTTSKPEPTIVWHLSYISTFIVKKSVQFHSKTLGHGLVKAAMPLPGTRFKREVTFHQDVTGI